MSVVIAIQSRQQHHLRIKVTPLDKKRAGGRSNISDEIKQQLTALEVPFNVN